MAWDFIFRTRVAADRGAQVYVAEVRVELKPGVADPEGANTKKALELLGFKGVKAVKSVHAFSIELDAASKGEAESAVSDMCKRLLVNPVIHVPRITLMNGGVRAGAGARAGEGQGKGRGQKAPSKKAKGAKATKATTKRAGPKSAKRASPKGGKKR